MHSIDFGGIGNKYLPADRGVWFHYGVLYACRLFKWRLRSHLRKPSSKRKSPDRRQKTSQRSSGKANETQLVLQPPDSRTTIPTQHMNKGSNDSGLSIKCSIRMVRIFLSATLLLVFALMLAPSRGAALQRVAGAPQLVLDHARHDFGDVFAGEDLSHAFWVRNNGSAPLELSETPQLGTRPSKVSFHPSPGVLNSEPFPKARRAAPS